MGKCVLRELRKVDVCYFGASCMAPFNQSGDQFCLDDKSLAVRGTAGIMGHVQGAQRMPQRICPGHAAAQQAQLASKHRPNPCSPLAPLRARSS